MQYKLQLLFIFISTLSYSQKGQVAAGGDAVGPGGSASYSIGQIDYISPSGSGGNSNEGLQQPYELFIVSTSVNETGNSFSVNMFPNPTDHSVNIEIRNSSFQNYSYKITDAAGKLISENKIREQKSTLSVSELSSGIYFIYIFEGTTPLKTYKLIKH